MDEPFLHAHAAVLEYCSTKPDRRTERSPQNCIMTFAGVFNTSACGVLALHVSKSFKQSLSDRRMPFMYTNHFGSKGNSSCDLAESFRYTLCRCSYYSVALARQEKFRGSRSTRTFTWLRLVLRHAVLQRPSAVVQP